MSKQNRENIFKKIADHPIIIIIGILASILGIIGWNVLDAIEKAKQHTEISPASATESILEISTRFRKTDIGWVELFEFKFEKPSILLRTIVPSGDLYDLISYINPEVRISDNNQFFITFDSSYDNDGLYPIFEIEDSVYDVENRIIEPKGFYGNNPSPYVSFPLLEKYTMFLKLDRGSTVRIHTLKLPKIDGATNLQQMNSNVALIISYIHEGQARFDGLLTP